MEQPNNPHAPQPAVVRRTTTLPGESQPVQEGSAIDSQPRPSELQGGYRGPIYRFTIPEKIRDPSRDPQTITLRELSPDDHITAARIASGKATEPRAISIATQYESAKMAIYLVDGRRIDRASFEEDVLFSKWSPKVQSLVMGAYARISSTTESEDDAFFASMVVG